MVEPTEEQRESWSAWKLRAPAKLRAAVEYHDLAPWKVRRYQTNGLLVVELEGKGRCVKLCIPNGAKFGPTMPDDWAFSYFTEDGS